MTTFYVTANACEFGLIKAATAQEARDLAAQMAGYESEADMEARLEQPSEIVAKPKDNLAITRYASDALPAYRQYPGQLQPQPGYIELDGNSVTADYSGEIGNAVPADVWHNRRLRWYINGAMAGSDINNLIDEITPLLEIVHAGHDEDWDGSNWVGVLTDEAQEASEQIERICADYRPSVEAWDVDTWLWNSCSLSDNWPADKTLDEAVSELEQAALGEAVLLGSVRDSLLEFAKNAFDSGDDLHENAIQALLDEGTVTPEQVAEYRDERGE
jgi:hypothetical protein